MSQQRIQHFKNLIPQIKDKIKTLRNSSGKKINNINFVPDADRALISYTDILGMTPLQKERVMKITKFLNDYVLKKAQIDLIENRCDYTELFSSFKENILLELDQIEDSLQKIETEMAGYATKFFENFDKGVLTDGELVNNFGLLVKTFALKHLMPSEDEMFKETKVYLDKGLAEIIKQIQNVNSNLLSEPFKKNFIKFKNSKILEPEEHGIINRWVAQQVGVQKTFVPIFNSSEHGFGYQAFHNQCDNKGPTIVFVKTETGRRFGGYANSSWVRGCGEITDEKCFIFSIDLKKKYLHKPGIRCSMFGNTEHGPIFGDGDLALANNCNSNIKSLYAANKTYDCGGASANDIAGSEHFTVERYEVYKVEQCQNNLTLTKKKMNQILNLQNIEFNC